MTVIATLAGIGMAVGPPLIYADQAYSIVKKKDSSGFSHDVCGVLLIANIIRVFFWLGNRFETPLLVQSLLLILSQLVLLAICLHYAPHSDSSGGDEEGDYAPLSPLPQGHDQSGQGNGHNREESDYLTQPPSRPHPVRGDPSAGSGSRANLFGSRAGSGMRGGTGTGMGMGKMKGLFVGIGHKRPFDFWQWEGYGSYLEFLAGLIVVLGVTQIIFGRWMWYIDALGFVALTIESTLPIPQFISNWRRKSCYGFRSSTLAGWFFGDSYKTVYFFLRHSPVQFQVTAILTVCWDSAVLAQRVIYGAEPPRGSDSHFAPASGSGQAYEEARGLASNAESSTSATADHSERYEDVEIGGR